MPALIRRNEIESKAAEILRFYPVKKAALFGSVARDSHEQGSDVDIIVEFFTDKIGLEFFGLKLDLEGALGCPVDLITYDSLTKAKDRFKASVKEEAHVFYER
jgi:predicted nucleotidyltransferase